LSARGVSGGISGPQPARPKRVASISGDDAVVEEEHESGWRVTYDDAPIGILQDAEQASRFACDIARMQAQTGRVTWVIVLAELEEVHRFETRAGAIKSANNFLLETESASRMLSDE
jgi:hypothetical protein